MSSNSVYISRECQLYLRWKVRSFNFFKLKILKIKLRRSELPFGFKPPQTTSRTQSSASILLSKSKSSQRSRMRMANRKERWERRGWIERTGRIERRERRERIERTEWNSRSCWHSPFGFTFRWLVCQRSGDRPAPPNLPVVTNHQW